MRICAVLFACALAGGPADPAYISFGSAVRVPGVTLEPGTYFLTADTPIGGQTVVDIYRIRDSVLVASVLAVETSEPRDVLFGVVEYRGPQPRALRAWFPLASRVGYEFVYSPSEASGLFLTAGQPVPATVFAGSPRSLIGMVPIRHVDEVERVNPFVIAPPAVEPPREPDSLDNLRLSRLAIATHLFELPEDVRTLCRLLDRQLRAVTGAYREGRPDLVARTRLAVATIGNLSAAARGHREAEHVAERVRERMRLFVEFIR